MNQRFLISCLVGGAVIGAAVGWLVAGKKGISTGAIIGIPWLLCPALAAHKDEPLIQETTRYEFR